MDMLNAIEAALKKQKLEVHRIPPGAANPMEQLVVVPPPDAQGRPRNVWLTPLSSPEVELAPGINLLQVFVELPFKVSASASPDLELLILHFNNALPLGAFGLQPGGPALYRCVVMMDNDEKRSARIALEAVILASFLTDQYGGALEAVAAGQKTSKQTPAEMKTNVR